MTCTEFTKYLDDYMIDNLSDDISAQMRGHIEQCEKCREEYEFAEKIVSHLHNADKIEVSDDFLNKLNKRIDAQNSSDNKLKKFIYGRKFLTGIAAAVIFVVIIAQTDMPDIGRKKTSGLSEIPHTAGKSYDNSANPQSIMPETNSDTFIPSAETADSVSPSEPLTVNDQTDYPQDTDAATKNNVSGISDNMFGNNTSSHSDNISENNNSTYIRNIPDSDNPYIKFADKSDYKNADKEMDNSPAEIPSGTADTKPVQYDSGISLNEPDEILTEGAEEAAKEKSDSYGASALYEAPENAKTDAVPETAGITPKAVSPTYKPSDQSEQYNNSSRSSMPAPGNAARTGISGSSGGGGGGGSSMGGGGGGSGSSSSASERISKYTISVSDISEAKNILKKYAQSSDAASYTVSRSDLPRIYDALSEKDIDFNISDKFDNNSDMVIIILQ